MQSADVLILNDNDMIMKKYLLIALIISQLPTFGQPLIKENFINCDTVIKELKSTENIKSLGYKYDYVFILLLDSSNIELIKKTGYQSRASMDASG